MSTYVLGQVVAANVRRLREERGWRQADLAARMHALGFAWLTNRVAQVETLRRHLDVLEFAGLCRIFGVPIDELLAGDGDVELPEPGRVMPLDDLHRYLREGGRPGETPFVVTGDAHLRATGSMTAAVYREDEERKAAARLGVPGARVTELALRLWGHSLATERDRRVGDLSHLPERTARAYRGRVTRVLLDELRAALADERPKKKK